MFLMILAMMIIGCFMDTTPAAIIMVPIFQPLAASFGFDPIHFGMVMVLTFIFGGITPPVGATLFIASSVGQDLLGEARKRNVAVDSSFLHCNDACGIYSGNINISSNAGSIR